MIDYLPFDIIDYIINKLHITDVCGLMCVNKNFIK